MKKTLQLLICVFFFLQACVEKEDAQQVKEIFVEMGQTDWSFLFYFQGQRQDGIGWTDQTA